VIDLQAVPYLSSTGLAESVQTMMHVRRQGGRLVICNLAERVRNVLGIGGLLNLFEVHDSVDEAVRSFAVARFEVSCPICQPSSWSKGSDGQADFTCNACNVHFALEPAQSADLREVTGQAPTASFGTASVKRLWWSTYGTSQAESVRLTIGRPTTLKVTGRLDLFVLDVVEVAWRCVPVPRRVLFDATEVESPTAVAWTRLSEICAAEENASRAAILRRLQEAERGRERRSQLPNVYTDRDLAIRTLGDARNSPESIAVQIRRLAPGPAGT
jgi:hypothetical protein